MEINKENNEIKGLERIVLPKKLKERFGLNEEGNANVKIEYEKSITLKIK